MPITLILETFNHIKGIALLFLSSLIALKLMLKLSKFMNLFDLLSWSPFFTSESSPLN